MGFPISLILKGRLPMKKLLFLLVFMIVAVSFFAGMVSAHVTVQPKETTQGSYELFTVRVPSEKEDVTTKIQIQHYTFLLQH